MSSPGSQVETRAANALAIAIDGPAGAGKSTVARELARRLGFFLLDTGAIYRSVAFLAGRRGIGLEDGPRLAEVARALPIAFEGERVLVGSEEVTAAIRTPEVSSAASVVSAHPEVRAALLELQRALARRGRCVVEGRDIGTVVLPWAPLKVFLTASPEVRARRRHDELVARGASAELDGTLAALRARDEKDETRAVAPLKQAEDAVLFDTSGMELPAVLDELERLARERLQLS